MHITIRCPTEVPCEIENLQLSHYSCNLSKGARIPAETPGFLPVVR